MAGSVPPPLPPPPPPAPPPGAWPPPPPGFYQAAGYPPGWLTSTPPGETTHRAIGEIADAIQLYWYALGLSLLASLVAAGALGEWFGGGFGYLTGTGAGSVETPNVSPIAVIALALLIGVFALIALILIILAWTRWRRGGDHLAGAASEYGPEAAAVAWRVRQDISRTTYVFIAALVVALVLGAIIAAVDLAGTLSTQPNLNNSTFSISTSLSASTLAELRVLVAVSVLISTSLQWLLYAFATRGHVDTIAPYAAPETMARAGRGRRWVILGVLVSFVGIGYPFVPYLALASVLSAGIIFYGFREILRSVETVHRDPLAVHPVGRPIENLMF